MMIRRFHERVVARAEATAATGHVYSLLGGIWREAAIWLVPVLVAITICAVFEIYGPESLWVSLPAVGIALVGSCLYVPWVYLAAMKRRGGS